MSSAGAAEGSVSDAGGVARAHGVEPFAADGGRTGVVLCHGFTGSPASLRPWAQALAEAGLSVRLPLLPGHGGTVADANRVRWSEWYDCIAREFVTLGRTCDHVFVFGLSMGGGLALRVAELLPTRVAGLVLVNPSVTVTSRRRFLLPLLKRVSASSPGIINDIAMDGQDEVGLARIPHRAMSSVLAMNRVIRKDLARVRAPILLYRSTVDHVVGPESAEIIEERVSGPFERRDLVRSYHVATLDYEAGEIIDGSLAFVKEVLGATDAPDPAGSRSQTRRR